MARSSKESTKTSQDDPANVKNAALLEQKKALLREKLDAAEVLAEEIKTLQKQVKKLLESTTGAVSISVSSKEEEDDSSSDSDDSDDSSSEEKEEEKEKPVKDKDDSSSDDSSSDDDSSSSEEEDKMEVSKTVAKKEVSKIATKKEVSKTATKKDVKEDDSSSEDDSDDSDDDSADPMETTKAKAKEEEDSDDDDSSDDDSDDDEKMETTKTTPAKVDAPKKTEEEDSSDDDDSEDEEEAEKEKKVPDKKRKAPEPEETHTSTKKRAVDTTTATNTDASADSNAITSIYVRGLPWRATEDEIHEFFSTCGTIASVEQPLMEDGRSSGTAIVTFEDTKAATAAVALNGGDFQGRWLSIQFNTPKTPKAMPQGGREPSAKDPGCVTVFIGNLAWDVDEDAIRQAFGNCGEITSVRFATDKETGDFKGFGHVEFTETEATDAAVAMAGTEICGRPVRVDFANDRRAAPSPGGGRGGGRGGRGYMGGGGGRGGGGRGGRGGRDGGRGAPAGRAKSSGAITAFSGNRITFD